MLENNEFNTNTFLFLSFLQLIRFVGILSGFGLIIVNLFNAIQVLEILAKGNFPNEIFSLLILCQFGILFGFMVIRIEVKETRFWGVRGLFFIFQGMFLVPITLVMLSDAVSYSLVFVGVVYVLLEIFGWGEKPENKNVGSADSKCLLV